MDKTNFESRHGFPAYKSDLPNSSCQVLLSICLVYLTVQVNYSVPLLRIMLISIGADCCNVSLMFMPFGKIRAEQCIAALHLQC